MGIPAVAFPGMRYWHPFIGEAVQRFKAEQVTQVVALSMYPHYSRATTGSCMEELRRAVKAQLPGLRVTTIDCWPRLPNYIGFIADKAAKLVESLAGENPSKTAVLFSAHGVPVRLIEKGDPYKDQVEESYRLVCDKLPPDTRSALGWQSAFGPAKWLEPGSKTLVAQFAKEGVENLVVVPLGFAAENIETLWDIEIDLKSFAEGQGIQRFLRIPCPNAEPCVMAGLAGLVTEAVEGSEA
jgi:ferrochelatase